MRLNILQPPSFCQYAAGPCDQDFNGTPKADAFFVFANEPPTISTTIQSSVLQLRRSKPNHRWTSWKDLTVAGQIIFCEICQNIRHASTLVADLTTLSFNVLFEIGYAYGLGKPVLLIRDTTYDRDARDLDELGILDTLGYEKYSNSDELVGIVSALVLAGKLKPLMGNIPASTQPLPPIYLVLPPVQSEGVLRLTSALKRSAFQYRCFDPTETPRLSLSEVERQVVASHAVAVKLMDPHRKGALPHNARCAFVAGVALALQKHVLMIQEGKTRQPVDYRDICQIYENPAQIQSMVERLVRQVATTMQRGQILHPEEQRSRLARLDLGDIAAENEEEALQSYFVQTAQFQETFRGHARLVVGRKGTGKSAIFSQIRNTLSRRAQQYVVLDLKPEEYQLKKLVSLLQEIGDSGSRVQTVAAFWDYVLLCELAHKIIDSDASFAYRDPHTLALYNMVRAQYQPQQFDEHGDFSERLMVLLGRLEQRFPTGTQRLSTPQITQIIWVADIAPLRDSVAEYLRNKKEVWLLVDNLDKSWQTKGASEHEILILRCLLEAARKLQRQLEKRKVPFKSVVFIRNDIYEQLISETPDRGKESRVSLDNTDFHVMEEILRRRAVSSLGENIDFESFNAIFFDRHVGGEDTFRYLQRHTLGRARDVLRLVKKCIETALNRGHHRVSEDDVATAVAANSDDLLTELRNEVKDAHGGAHADLIKGFTGISQPFGREEVQRILQKRNLVVEELPKIIDTLLWYSFLGIELPDGRELYSYQEGYDVERMLTLAERPDGILRLIIHPAFRSALHVRN